ncbi:DUF374 domain-containing protein [Hespellia stercorisuis]|uniref:DUF374 domain-containing protein n=1 Tax=Hespellia stercorisuis DSM 15480 TaxID=1121950 RepID=A0A1M6I8B7_9FIRM|nr:DUF374 domain-containing protein [Hespellia stercorisuis]SHJ30692.1 hypothetical protein SAMN02745243_00270 [Hespellia stercorisuis DSM 15480]
MFREKWQKIAAGIMTAYIRFVYKTSKVCMIGFEKIKETDRENVVAAFWHGDSYCLYPALAGMKLYVVATKDSRGDYISEICQHFGYRAIRLPDNPDGGNYIFKIKKLITQDNAADLAITLDGPLGPYHLPKYFPLALAYLTKRNIIPVSVQVKRKIELKKRWDAFKIPLPFNEMEIRLHEAVKVTKEDKDEKFISLIKNIQCIMEANSR